jgi:signal peptidase
MCTSTICTPAPAPSPAVLAPAAAVAPSPLLPSAAVVAASQGQPRRRPLARVGTFLSGLVLAAATLAAMALAIATVVMGLGFSPVLSPSMEPVFAAGDVIVTRALDTSDIAVGQVLVLPVPGSAGERFVHRVTDVRYEQGQPLVRTKGDNNAAADPWELRVTSSQVPIVVTSVPEAGRLGLLVQAGGARLALLGLVTFLALVGIKRALLG